MEVLAFLPYVTSEKVKVAWPAYRIILKDLLETAKEGKKFT